MITLSDYAVEVERRKNEMARAEQYRLSRQVPRHVSSLEKRYRYTVARLGKLLVSWGCRLQNRFVEDTCETRIRYRYQSTVVRPE